MSTQTYWNGEPTPCERVRVVVADDPRFPQYWARTLVGYTVDAVRVTYGGRVFYLYDDDGSGWAKVTRGRGGPFVGHREIAIHCWTCGEGSDDPPHLESREGTS